MMVNNLINGELMERKEGMVGALQLQGIPRLYQW